MINWKPLNHHPVQAALWRTTKRFPVVVAGRGSGKSELAKRRVVRFLAVEKPWPDPLYFYALPTYAQAKRVAWDSILKLIPPDWIDGEPLHSRLMLRTKFGSSLYVVGLDKPARIEGVQWDGGIVDECSDQRPKVFDLNIRPALSHRNGWCWRIGVPKRFGIGASEFKSAYDLGLSGEDNDVETFTWMSEDILPQEEIISAKTNLTLTDYNEQYRAQWESTSGSIFYNFTPLNIQDVTYKEDVPLVIGSDFNVDPMCWCIGHLAHNGLIVFDEIVLRNTNTQATLDELYKRYGSHKAGFLFFGDASGRARKSSASVTDYAQIKNDSRFFDSKVFYLKSNPPVADRFASCNALLCNANGERRLLVHPRCKRLIADLNSRAYKPGVREPDDHGDLGHMSDALGYIVYRAFPVRIHNSGKSVVTIK